uniref:Uncharacterized protein n=1 Tax=Rhizophora mucronata TaxID=61149 RepID=A0A2P2NXU4_RHIMU
MEIRRMLNPRQLREYTTKANSRCARLIMNLGDTC